MRSIRDVWINGGFNEEFVEDSTLVLGTIAGRTKSGDNTITNCCNYADLILPEAAANGNYNSRALGGIIGSFGRRNGYNQGTLLIEDCRNYGKIVGVNPYSIGGILGTSFQTLTVNDTDTITIRRCSNESSGSVTAMIYPHNAGVCHAGGVSCKASSFIECYNKGEVACYNKGEKEHSAYAAGIGSGNQFISCSNSGFITSEDYGYGYYFSAAGIANSGRSFISCYNTGNIKGCHQVAGIASYPSPRYTTLTLTDCYNSGDISGKSTVGGLIGIVDGDGNGSSTDISTIISNSYNLGSIHGSDATGGLVGFTANAELNNCYNAGSVSGSSNAGGLLGTIYKTINIKNCYNAGLLTTSGSLGQFIGYANGSYSYDISKPGLAANITIDNSFYLQTDTVNAGLNIIGKKTSTVNVTGTATAINEAQLRNNASVTFGGISKTLISWLNEWLDEPNWIKNPNSDSGTLGSGLLYNMPILNIQSAAEPTPTPTPSDYPTTTLTTLNKLSDLGYTKQYVDGKYRIYDQEGTEITDLKIPYGIIMIGKEAVYNCNALTSITIPDSVTSIGDYAFDGCRGITSLTIPDSVTEIGYHAFEYCTSLTSLKISNNVTTLNGFAGCSSLTSVTIPNSVTAIGKLAFSNCDGLTSVTIPNGVKTIGWQAFGSCDNLTSVSIPNSVTSMDSGVFICCKKLDSVNIPNSLTRIESETFYQCSSLASISIPNSITSIGSSAFYQCTGLSSVNIPSSVTSIGSNAFKEMPHIYYNGTATGAPWGAYAIN